MGCDLIAVAGTSARPRTFKKVFLYSIYYLSTTKHFKSEESVFLVYEKMMFLVLLGRS